MTKNKLLLFVLLLITISFSSCGIFGKGCGCPEFGYVKADKAHHKEIIMIRAKASIITYTLDKVYSLEDS